MASSSTASNPLLKTDSSRRKKKKLEILSENHNRRDNRQKRNRWRTDKEEQTYSSNLLQALRRSPSSNGRSVRETADRTLAATDNGKSRWSRAILTNRLKLKFMRHKKVARAGRKKPRVSVMERKNLPAVHRKARFLGRLVPGCRKESLPVILEEAADYIPALEMQVRVLAALAANLSVSGAATRSPPPN